MPRRVDVLPMSFTTHSCTISSASGCEAVYFSAVAYSRDSYSSYILPINCRSSGDSGRAAMIGSILIPLSVGFYQIRPVFGENATPAVKKFWQK